MKEEKHIKDSLQDYESPMEMDAVWAALEGQLDEADKEDDIAPVIIKADSGNMRKIWPLLMLLLIAGCGFFSYKQMHKTSSSTPLETAVENSKSQPQSARDPIVKINTGKVDTETGINSTTNGAQTNEIKTPESQVNTTINKNVINNQRNQNTDIQSSTPNQPKNTEENVVPNKNMPSVLALIPSEKNAQNYVRENETAIIKENNTSSNSLLPNETKASTVLKGKENLHDELEELNVNDIRLLPNLTRGITSLIVFKPKSIVTLLPFSSIATKPITKKIYRIGFHAGLNTALTDIFNMEGELLMQASTRSIDSTTTAMRKPTIGLKAECVYPSGLKLSTALNYMNLGYGINKVDSTLVGQDIESIDEETLPTVNTETTVVTSTTYINEYEVRQSLKTRDIQALQIPILIGLEKRHKRLDCSASIGVGINLVLSHEIPFYLQSEPRSISLTTGLSGLAEMQLGYKLNEKLRVYGIVNGGRTFTNIISLSDNDLDIKVGHYALRIGMSYEF